MNFLSNLRNILLGKLGANKKHSEPAKPVEVWDLVPDLFNSVPMPLVHFTLSQLALGNTKDSPHFHAPVLDIDNEHLKATLSYDIIGAYFCGGTLCLDVRITYFSEDVTSITSKHTIMVTMASEGTVPYWFGHCVSLSTEILKDEKSKLLGTVMLSEEAELWLRVIYLTNNPVLVCTKYIREHSNKELIKKAIQFIDKHNVPFQVVPHQQASPTVAVSTNKEA